ncbi:MAG: hypothetical protein COB46_14360 [Rhodospirillaceae bacterium]|nr:MAG: hypothetical protein COB46_14360 [Rhodospirillaceae bacterium]
MIKSLYQDHFGVRENPFSILPDPSYLFMSERHQEALAHMAYGISGHGGFVLLTGEVGTGKTTICRALIENLPQDAELALILNPKLSEAELLATICDEMHITYEPGTTSLKVFFDLINDALLAAHAAGRNQVLLIDEAQNLSNPVLELIRLLTNLETSEKKLLQIILVGQPELNEILAQESQRQTAQRITARYHLLPLTQAETQQYITHRMSVAGLDGDVFSAGACKVIFKAANGIPRLINSVCDRALLAAYVEGRKQISKKLALGAAQEVFTNPGLAGKSSVLSSLVLVLTVLGLLIWIGLDPFGTGVQNKIKTFVAPYLPIYVSEPAPVAPAPELKETVTAPVTPATPAKPQDISSTKGSALDALIQSGTPDIAFQGLFELWGKDYAQIKGNGPCEKAKTAGLDCSQGQTDLLGLKTMNRPVVTSLVMPDGEHIYGIVAAIKNTGDTEQVRLDFLNRSLTLSTKAFVLRWPGDYLVLWNNAFKESETLTFGRQGKDVQELRRLLAVSGYSNAPNNILGKGSLFFGPTLRDTIQAFQTDHGLSADGTPSPETLMHITGAAKSTALPALYPPKGGQHVLYP